MTTVTADELVITGTGNSSFRLLTRANVTTFPAAFAQPTVSDKVMAVDLMPNGNPVELTGHGITWLDLCDADLHANSSAPTTCARIGIREDFVEIGSRSFNGGTIKPIVFTVGNSPNPVTGFKLETTGALSTKASVSATAGLIIPHGATPTTPADGSVWTTTSGMFVRINGTTKQIV